VTKAFIFGFDDEQKTYLDGEILEKKNENWNYSLKERSYSIGNINTNNVQLSTIFNGNPKYKQVLLWEPKI